MSAPSAEVFWRPDAGLWWPVADADPAKAWAYVSKRLADSDVTVKACRRHLTCVQAGGYVGVWPMRLARSFARVLTFEIMPGCLEACRRNTAALGNVEVIGCGLGAVAGVEAAVQPSGTAGSWRLDPEGPLTARMTTIDALALADCDAIVLDIEGGEAAALEGAAATIARCRPVIHMEERKENLVELPRLMARLGYRQHARVHADAVYVPA